jgi:hypothetical protein
VTLLRRRVDGGTDEYGNPELEVVEQETSAELQLVGAHEAHGGAVMVDTWKFWLPANAPARGWDALELLEDGTMLELRGDPWIVRNPRTGAVHHVEGWAVVRE